MSETFIMLSLYIPYNGTALTLFLFYEDLAWCSNYDSFNRFPPNPQKRGKVALNDFNDPGKCV